jgi:hypothetical protein
MNLSSSLITLSLVLVLAGCGGSEAQPPLVTIGNSLTRMPPTPEYHWTHDWGADASDQAHDYAHVTGTILDSSSVSATNVADLEFTPAQSHDLIAPATANVEGANVVVELGDNAEAGGTQDFADAYGALLDAVVAKHPHKLVCTSTWWRDDGKDALEHAACEAHGGTWVYIGDIFPVRTDVIDPNGDPGIELHPHDPSMAIIAARVAAAFGGSS